MRIIYIQKNKGYIESSIVPYNNILNLVDIVYVISIPKELTT